MEATGKEEISVEDEAVDKNIFKDCSKIAFYRRQKQQLSKKSTYRALLDSVTTGKDSTRFQIINEVAKVRCQDQSTPDLGAFEGEEATVREDPQELSTRQHRAQKGAEEPDKQEKLMQDVSNMAPKTENWEDHLEQTPCSACLQVFTRNHTSGSFSKDAGVSLNTSTKLPLASSHKHHENETVPNQPPPQQMRNYYHLLARTVSAEMARNRQLTWELDRLVVFGERANAQHELASVLRRESVLAIIQLPATVLQQFSELLNHSLNPGRP
uniref:Glucosidase alpha, neutral C n=1 Tax=Catagonus wagneri TaxID=51154 RepID=A0A8C3YC95_9CETA